MATLATPATFISRSSPPPFSACVDDLGALVDRLGVGHVLVDHRDVAAGTRSVGAPGSTPANTRQPRLSERLDQQVGLADVGAGDECSLHENLPDKVTGRLEAAPFFVLWVTFADANVCPQLARYQCPPRAAASGLNFVRRQRRVDAPPVVAALVGQVAGLVGTGGQVVVDRRAAMEGLGFLRVEVGHERDAPQLVAPVVVVGPHRHPGVLVGVEHALAVDVAHAGLERALDHPDAVQLVAHVVGVDRVRLDQVLVLDRRVVEPEVVVRHVELLLADQLPGVALGRAVEDVVVVHRAQAGRRHRVVEADFRRLAHAADARLVLPGLQVASLEKSLGW